jgi:predicted N-acyltransferase
MGYKKNGHHRNKTFTVTKTTPDGVTTVLGTHNILSFNGNTITEDAFNKLSDTDYNLRLDAFYQYIEDTHKSHNDFERQFNSRSEGLDSHGDGLSACQA